MIGIAFSSASLMVALLIGWMNSRRETYLVRGATGIALIVIGVAAMGLRDGRYGLVYSLLPYSLLLPGFALIYSASRLLCNNRTNPQAPLILGVISVLTTAMPFVAGYSGIGTILLNIWAAVLMLLCAREFWHAREETRVAMLATVLLYVVTALSFAACAVVLVSEQSWFLTAPADNWAEDFNSIMSLVGLTGIGAITLTLHHARAARRHHEEANTDPPNRCPKSTRPVQPVQG